MKNKKAFQKKHVQKVFVGFKRQKKNNCLQDPWQIKIEQTSNLIKVPNRIIQGLMNAVVSAVEINPQEIATPNRVAKSNPLDKGQQVWVTSSTRQNVKNKHHSRVRTSFSQRL
jgi:hypothetical protein